METKMKRMRFEDRGELSTAVICLFDLNATAETAEGTEGGRAAMFVEMPPKGTHRRRRGQCRPNEGTEKGASKNW